MKNIYHATLWFIFVGWINIANAEIHHFTLDLPQCKTLADKPLPAKYYVLAKKRKPKGFKWVNNVKSNDLSAGGGGYERVDGSGMYNWYRFDKLDINGDDTCDWFVTSIAPFSTGGDSGVLNTIYLGVSNGWKRFGATIPNDRPDGLGFGKSDDQQSDFAFSSETPLVVMDKKTRKPYLIGYFSSRRDAGRMDQKGYHIYVWNSSQKKLEELNKWEPGSAGSQVYAYFKEHGAVDPTRTGAERVARFDRAVEADELTFNCEDKDLVARSRGFAGACERARPKR